MIDEAMRPTPAERAALLAVCIPAISYDKAAELLGISRSALLKRLQRLYRKLGVNSAGQAAWLLLDQEIQRLRKRLGPAAYAPDNARETALPVVCVVTGQRWAIPPWVNPTGHYVYVAWSAADPEEALYVGASSQVLMRLGTHATSSLWWPEAAWISLHEHSTRVAADACEQRTILRLDPRYNVVRLAPVVDVGQ